MTDMILINIIIAIVTVIIIIIIIIVIMIILLLSLLLLLLLLLLLWEGAGSAGRPLEEDPGQEESRRKPRESAPGLMCT